MLSRARGRGRRWIPVPQWLSCAATAPRSLPEPTSRCGPSLHVLDAYRGAARQPANFAPAARLPDVTRAALARPSPVACWSSQVLSCLCPSWLPPARRRTVANCPCSPEQTQAGAHTLKSGHGGGMQASSAVRHKARHSPPAIQAMSGKDRAAFRCCRHAHGAGCVVREGRMPSWAVHTPERRARLAVCAGNRRIARQGMMASTVFFSALGWAGDLGAFSRARSSLPPSSCSCLRPRPARTLGNQSCSSSSM